MKGKHMKSAYQLIGESAAVKKLNRQIQQLAASTRSVLIVGESGVGRTTAARYIHFSSKDRNKPFVTISAQTTPDEEFKAVLFPDEVKREGPLPKQLPELVEGSTLFLKDVEELSFSDQSRFLRYLEDRKGKVRVRIIATIKEPLQKCQEGGKLMASLVEKLSSYETLVIPPLRERPEDLPALAEHFVLEACRELGIRVKAIDVNTLDLLSRFDWKGNVRELKAVIDRAVHQSEGEMLSLPQELLDEKSHLQGIINNIEARKRFSMDLGLENIEKLLLQRMLRAFGYNQTRVAEALGITEGNLRYRLKKYNIPSSRQR